MSLSACGSEGEAVCTARSEPAHRGHLAERTGCRWWQWVVGGGRTHLRIRAAAEGGGVRQPAAGWAATVVGPAHDRLHHDHVT